VDETSHIHPLGACLHLFAYTGSLGIQYLYLRIDDQSFLDLLQHHTCKWAKPAMYVLQVLASICLLSRSVLIAHRLFGNKVSIS